MSEKLFDKKGSYIGPYEDTQLLIEYKIEKDFLNKAEAKGQYNQLIDIGYEAVKDFIQNKIPEAVYRIGCNCCYGEGPNIIIICDNQDPKYFIIRGYVDFDFKLE